MGHCRRAGNNARRRGGRAGAAGSIALVSAPPLILVRRFDDIPAPPHPVGRPGALGSSQC